MASIRSSVLVTFKNAGGGAKSVDRVDFDGPHIQAGDLKAKLADKMRFPVAELVLSDEAGNEYDRGTTLIAAHTSVNLLRLPEWTKHRQAVLEVDTTAAKELPDGPEHGPALPKAKRAVPSQFLCALCSKPFWQPVLLGCCGESACTPCARDPCPFCGQRGHRAPNQALVSAMQAILTAADCFEVEESWKERFTYAPGPVAPASEAAGSEEKNPLEAAKEELKKEKKEKKRKHDKEPKERKKRAVPAVPPLLSKEQYELFIRGGGKLAPLQVPAR